MSDRNGILHIDGYAGRTRQDVIVVGETPKRYRIRCATEAVVRLAGRQRTLAPGETILVPRSAVTFPAQERCVAWSAETMAERLKRCVSMLYIHGLLPEPERISLRHRLAKRYPGLYPGGSRD